MSNYISKKWMWFHVKVIAVLFSIFLVTVVTGHIEGFYVYGVVMVYGVCVLILNQIGWKKDKKEDNIVSGTNL